MSDQTVVAAECPSCGAQRFKLPPHPKPDDEVLCVGCGKVFLYEEIRGLLVKKGVKTVAELLRDKLGK